MTTFDEREKSFEKKFELDQELQFKVKADFEKPGDADVLHKLMRDLAAAGKPYEDHTILKQAERLQVEAKKQIMADSH